MATKANKPATAVFVTGVRDAFKTIDAYKQKGVEPINSVAGLFEQAQSDLVGALRGGKQSGIGIPLFGKIGLDGKININKDALISRALTFGASLDIGKNVSNALKFGSDGMINSMLGSFNQAKEEVYVEIDGVRKPLEKPGGILNTINSIGSSINAFTGTSLFKIRDASGQETFMKSLIVQGLKDGIPSTFKSLTKGLTDPRTIRKVAGNVLGDAVKSFDIKGLIGTGGIASVLGVGGAKLSTPMIVRDVSSNFELEAGIRNDQLREKLTDIKDLYSLSSVTKAVEGAATGGAMVHYSEGYASGNAVFKETMRAGALSDGDPDNEEILVAMEDDDDGQDVIAQLRASNKKEFATPAATATPVQASQTPSNLSLANLDRAVKNMWANPDSWVKGTKENAAFNTALEVQSREQKANQKKYGYNAGGIDFSNAPDTNETAAQRAAREKAMWDGIKIE